MSAKAPNAKISRMKRELEMLNTSPPPGVCCMSNDSKLDHLDAQIIGGEGTPYEKGVFKLDIHITDRYPFEPPNVTFVTPIYHPNIDDAGRICLDILKMPPKGAWRPSINISTVLTSIQLLMAEPNPDDPLMANIAELASRIGGGSAVVHEIAQKYLCVWAPIAGIMLVMFDENLAFYIRHRLCAACICGVSTSLGKASEFKHNRPSFDVNARHHTSKHAMQNTSQASNVKSEKHKHSEKHPEKRTLTRTDKGDQTQSAKSKQQKTGD